MTKKLLNRELQLQRLAIVLHLFGSTIRNEFNLERTWHVYFVP